MLLQAVAAPVDLQQRVLGGMLPRVSTRDFQFQQFRVRQSASAMKVCTDATVFGAMAPLEPGCRVLDIGAGTGLLALMAAQRGAAQVHAIELDADAANEAADNFACSPWARSLSLAHGDVRDPATHGNGGYQLIICNPPFFADQTLSNDPKRRRARHADQLFIAELLELAGRLLSDQGFFYVLLPCERVPAAVRSAAGEGLYPQCQTDIRGYAHQPGKLSAITFARATGVLIERCLTVYDGPRSYSEQAAAYLGDFLLRFAGAKEE